MNPNTINTPKDNLRLGVWALFGFVSLGNLN